MCPCSHASAGGSSFRKWAGLNMFESSTALCARQWHGLHECSYCYCMVYTSTRNLDNQLGLCS